MVSGIPFVLVRFVFFCFVMGGVCVRGRAGGTDHPRRTSSTVTTVTTGSKSNEIKSASISGSNTATSSHENQGEHRDKLELLWRSFCEDPSAILQDSEADAFFSALGILLSLTRFLSLFKFLSQTHSFYFYSCFSLSLSPFLLSFYLGVDPDGFDSLVLQQRLGFPELLQIDKDRFLSALERFNITSIESLRTIIPQWIKETRENPVSFRYVCGWFVLPFLSFSFVNLMCVCVNCCLTFFFDASDT